MEMLPSWSSEMQWLLSRQPAVLDQLLDALLDDLICLGLFRRGSDCLHCGDLIEVQGLTCPRPQFGSCFHPLLFDQIEHPVTQLPLPELLVLPGEPELEVGQVDSKVRAPVPSMNTTRMTLTARSLLSRSPK